MKRIPWNKGKVMSHEQRLKLRKAHLGVPLSKTHRESLSKAQMGRISAMKGKNHSSETKAKISAANSGNKAYQWKGGYPNCKHCNKQLSTRKNTGLCIKCYIKFAQKTGIYHRIAINSMKKRGISKLERKVLSTIEKHKLPYKYVGDGQFKIGGKIPDFVNTNGKKIAVETYYEGHKKLFRGGLNEWKSDRQEIFKEYGWEIVFIPEYFSSEAKVLDLLKGGNTH